MKAEIYQGIDRAWIVECCEPENDGICHKAIFYGMRNAAALLAKGMK